MSCHHFILTLSYQSPPYALFKESPERLLGNEAFEGFGVELIQGIADFLSKIVFSKLALSPLFILQTLTLLSSGWTMDNMDRKT